MNHSINVKGGDIIPVKYIRGNITQWQHTFSHTDKERQIIEKHMEVLGLTYILLHTFEEPCGCL